MSVLVHEGGEAVNKVRLESGFSVKKKIIRSGIVTAAVLKKASRTTLKCCGVFYECGGGEGRLPL